MSPTSRRSAAAPLVALAALGLSTPAASAAPAAIVRQILPAGVEPIHYEVAIRPDAAALAFSGKVVIDIDVRAATDRIVVNAADLAIDGASLDGGTPLVVAVDKAAETASFSAPAPIAPGRHKLSIAWHGAISRFTSGFFALDYQGPDGAPRRMVATKFEPAAARRFMPLWDEPGRKASYHLTADVPEGELAISNTPIEREAKLGGGLKRVSFARTPKMSSYLLFFASGDLERISRKVGKVEIGIVSRRGVGARGAYALDAAAQLLPYYESYFGVDYPLAKLDLIAGPGSGSFGAMENWGAIFFFENRLLIDPERATEARRQSVYAVVAHEMAHQWFGNLVTMKWWDDLWLNEGFASWMGTRAADHFHPEWHPWLASQIDRAGAMRLDALPGTHPVIQDVASGPAANQAFDSITYDKGEAVLRMIEAWVGEPVFRAGLGAYMRAHAYGNTTNSDLWGAVGLASRQPVAGVAATFLAQPGVPLIRVGSDGSLSQSRFSYDPAVDPASGRWTIPLALRPLAGDATKRLLLRPEGGRAPGSGPWLVNAGQAAYARIAYDDGAFAPIPAALPRLDPADQIGLIGDAWALAQAGAAPAPRALDLIAALPADAEPRAWSQALSVLAEIGRLEAGGPGEQAWRGFVRKRLAAPFARLGWDAKAGESPNDAVLREALILALGRAGDPAVLAEAQSRFAAWRQDPKSVPAALVEPVLALAGRQADAAGFAALRAAARAEADPERKIALYTAMAGVKDPALAAQMLDIATSGEAPPSRAAVLVALVAEEHPDLAWAHANAHLEAVAPNLDLRQRYQYLPRVAGASSDPARADQLHAVAARDYPADARRFADQAEAGIRQRAAARARVLPEIDRWVAAR